MVRRDVWFASTPGVNVQTVELQILAGGGIAGPMRELAAQFERVTGHRLVIRFGTTPELIKLARARPGEVNWSAGGSPSQLSAELFKRNAGIDVNVILYKGNSLAVTALISGEVSLSFGNVAQDEGSAMAELAWKKGWRKADLAKDDTFVYFKAVVSAFKARWLQLGGTITFAYTPAGAEAVSSGGGTFGTCGTNKCHNNGQLGARRQQQALAWMWERIESGLRQQFHTQPKVRAALAELTQQVALGQVPASTAARQLLALAQAN